MRNRILLALDWYDVQIHEGVAACARERDWIINPHMARVRQLPRGWMGDGVIALVDRESTARFVRELNLPVVDLGGHFTEFPQVLGDHFRLGTIAANYLLERNHRNFVFFHLHGSRLERELATGLSMTLEASGAPCEMRYFSEDGQGHATPYEQVQNWIAAQLDALPTPLAVMTQNDDTSAIALEAALEAGYRVPEDVAVLGAGNTALVCDFLPRRLSSVDSNMKGLGYQAARELDRLMQGGRPWRTPLRVPPGAPVTRESTDFLAVSNPHVLKVLRYIWDHYSEPIGVEDLAALVPVSRSSLYNLFLREIGRPMAKELTRVRINEARNLLASTNHPVGEIASRCGFASLISFSRAFSRHTGISPSEFRAARREASARESAPAGGAPPAAPSGAAV